MFSLDVLFEAFCHILKYSLRVRGQRASEDHVMWTHSVPACPCSRRWCCEGVAGSTDLCRGRRLLLPEGVLEADSVGPHHAHLAVAVWSRVCTPVPRGLSWLGLSPEPGRAGRVGAGKRPIRLAGRRQRDSPFYSRLALVESFVLCYYSPLGIQIFFSQISVFSTHKDGSPPRLS